MSPRRSAGSVGCLESGILLFQAVEEEFPGARAHFYQAEYVGLRE